MKKPLILLLTLSVLLLGSACGEKTAPGSTTEEAAETTGKIYAPSPEGVRPPDAQPPPDTQQPSEPQEERKAKLSSSKTQ